MRNIKLTLQYDGTEYFGWQRQKNTHRTVQEVVETALHKIIKERVSLLCAGRTDAGVHAAMQVANFTTRSAIPAVNIGRALNAALPADIRVILSQEVPLAFHSTHQVKSKTYRYTIQNGPVHDVFLRRYACWYAGRLDIKKMRQAAAVLVGRHDFSAFRNLQKHTRKTTVRRIDAISLKRSKGCILIDVSGRGFLYNMVRTIAGTLMDVGRGKIPPADLKKILAAKNRSWAGPTAPAHGLCLLKVLY